MGMFCSGLRSKSSHMCISIVLGDRLRRRGQGTLTLDGTFPETEPSLGQGILAGNGSMDHDTPHALSVCSIGRREHCCLIDIVGSRRAKSVTSALSCLPSKGEELSSRVLASSYGTSPAPCSRCDTSQYSCMKLSKLSFRCF